VRLVPWLVAGLLAAVAVLLGAGFWALVLVELCVGLGYCLRGLQETLRDLRELRQEQDGPAEGEMPR
jgi:hypothetical protein